jgi:hypothetical protein
VECGARGRRDARDAERQESDLDDVAARFNVFDEEPPCEEAYGC